jgi:hypothetical protein
MKFVPGKNHLGAKKDLCLVKAEDFYCMTLYSASTDKVERNRYLPASGWNCCNVSNFILLFYGAILDSYGATLHRVAVHLRPCNVRIFNTQNQ